MSDETDSPCVGICQIDEESDTCIGCGRTSAEIFGETASAPRGAEAETQLAQPPQRAAGDSGDE
ncbi:MAG: DUF1289 domain-containing protein [Zoogloea sp.]|nr:DUF1289 domain-containing protein [Zoogloea sp.]